MVIIKYKVKGRICRVKYSDRKSASAIASLIVMGANIMEIKTNAR